MRPEQEPLAAWMREVMAQRGITAQAWAKKAGLGRDTVSRAVRADYDCVTSSRTIARLADAVGQAKPSDLHGIPTEEALRASLECLIERLASSRIADTELTAISAALRETLIDMAEQPETALDARLAKALALSHARQRS